MVISCIYASTKAVALHELNKFEEESGAKIRNFSNLILTLCLLHHDIFIVCYTQGRSNSVAVTCWRKFRCDLNHCPGCEKLSFNKCCI